MSNQDQTISGVQSASQSGLAKMYNWKKIESLVNLMPQHIHHNTSRNGQKTCDFLRQEQSSRLHCSMLYEGPSY